MRVLVAHVQYGPCPFQQRHSHLASSLQQYIGLFPIPGAGLCTSVCWTSSDISRPGVKVLCVPLNWSSSIWHVNPSPLTYYHPQWGRTLSLHASGWWCYWTILAPVYYWSPAVQPIFTSPDSPVFQPVLPQLLSKSVVETVLRAFLKPSSLISTAPPPFP